MLILTTAAESHLQAAEARTPWPCGQQRPTGRTAGRSSGRRASWWCGRCSARCRETGRDRSVEPSPSRRPSAAASCRCRPQSHTCLEVTKVVVIVFIISLCSNALFLFLNTLTRNASYLILDIFTLFFYHVVMLSKMYNFSLT